MFDNREIIEFCDVVTYFARKQYQSNEEKNEFFNSFIYRVVLFDDCIYIFYNTSPNMPTKVKLDKSDLAELREYRTNKKALNFNRLGSNWVLVAERTGFEPAIPFGIPAFQASTFDRSDISPQSLNYYNRYRAICPAFCENFPK